MAAEVSSIARMLRGEAGNGRGGAAKPSEMVTMDLLGGCGGDAGVGDEVVDLEVKVPAGWERRLDLLSGKTFLTPHLHQAAQDGHQDLNLTPTASTAAAVTTTSAAFCTIDMVRYALERRRRTVRHHAGHVVLLVGVHLILVLLPGKAQPLAAFQHGVARREPGHARVRVPVLLHVRAHHRGRPLVPAVRIEGAVAA